MQHLFKADLLPLELYMWCMISFTDCGTNSVSYNFCCEEQYVSWHAWTNCGKIYLLCTLRHLVWKVWKRVCMLVCCSRCFCLRLHAWKCLRGFCCLSMLGCFRDFFWPVKKCEFPTVMVGVLLLADITKVPRLPSCVSRITFLLLGVNQKLIILHYFHIGRPILMGYESQKMIAHLFY